MNTDGPAFLCKSNNVSFHFFTGCHHQVRHFIDNDDDEWQVIGDEFRFLFILGLESIE